VRSLLLEKAAYQYLVDAGLRASPSGHGHIVPRGRQDGIPAPGAGSSPTTHREPDLRRSRAGPVTIAAHCRVALSARSVAWLR
jgi:hypothetical protein